MVTAKKKATPKKVVEKAKAVIKKVTAPKLAKPRTNQMAENQAKLYRISAVKQVPGWRWLLFYGTKNEKVRLGMGSFYHPTKSAAIKQIKGIVNAKIDAVTVK